MIGDVLSLLRDQLDAFLRAAAPALDENPADARVQLPDGAKADPIEFRLNAITLLLVNIEQETGLRSADQFDRLAELGDRLGTAVDEAWKTAQAGQSLSAARAQIDGGRIHAELAAARTAPPTPRPSRRSRRSSQRRPAWTRRSPMPTTGCACSTRASTRR